MTPTDEKKLEKLLEDYEEAMRKYCNDTIANIAIINRSYDRLRNEILNN